jgi:hypothetical protein
MTIQIQAPRFIPRDYDVFGGLDVDKKSMSVVFTDHTGSQRALRMAHQVTPLLNYVGKHFAGQRVAFAYEAGPTGLVCTTSLCAELILAWWWRHRKCHGRRANA